MIWVVPHEITGWYCVRDKFPTVKKWLEKQVWISDGAPAAHGTWGLTL